MFIVGWGHGNHAFVKHALRTLRCPPSPCHPPGFHHHRRPWSGLPPHCTLQPFGWNTVVEMTSATPDAGHATGCSRSPKPPRTTARATCPLAFKFAHRTAPTRTLSKSPAAREDPAGSQRSYYRYPRSTNVDSRGCLTFASVRDGVASRRISARRESNFVADHLCTFLSLQILPITEHCGNRGTLRMTHPGATPLIVDITNI